MTTTTTVLTREYESELAKRLERSERFRRLAEQAQASTVPALVTTSGLVVPKGWGK